MTISSAYAPDTYAGNGSLDTFAITFEFLSVSTNVKVSIKVDSTGVITEKTAATHYNVSGSNVVFTAGNIPASGETVILELDPDFTQDTDYSENGSLPAETLESDLDERCLESQINNDLISRAFRVDSSEDISSAVLAVGLPSSGTEILTVTSSGLSSSTAAALDVLTLPVSVANGGTGASSLTSDAILTGNGTSAIQAESTVAVTSGVLTVSNGATSGGKIAFVEDSDNGSNTITLQAPDSIASNFTLKLPSADGTSNQAVVTDGSGNLSFATISAGLSNVVEDTTPQLGGDLDLNGNQITSPDGTDLIDIPNGSIDLQTASTSRLDITDSGVRLGAANARVTTILDEDTMSSDSATALATQQSIKAYVDSVASGGAWTLITSTTASGAASVDFTGLSSTYHAYAIVFNNLIPATDDTALYVRTDSDAGASFDSGASDYSWIHGGGRASAGTTYNTYNTTDTADSQIKLSTNGGSVGHGSAANESASGIIYVLDPSSASYTFITWSLGFINAAGNITNTTGSGYRLSTTATDAVQVLMSSGNISGEFRLYGITNA